jgi:cation:H+ antiporter
MLSVLMFIGGTVLLLVGAEWLVNGASRLAASLGVSALLIGLTVVSFGTSAPELAVSLFSVSAGQADIAVGNVIGSNIFNVLLILGLSAVVAPLVVSQQLVILDVPIMVGASIAVLVLGLDGRIGQFDGLLLFGALVAYLVFLGVTARRGKAHPGHEIPELPEADEAASASPGAARLRNLGLIVVGLAMLVLGSRLLVEAAVNFALYLGVSELVIGLTVVALGTSLPELATSVVASARGERDIAVGNVVGSNLFNLLCVLGLTGLVAPHGIAVSGEALRFDLPVMIAVAIACLPIFFCGNAIKRWEGALFLGYCVVYVTRTVLHATDSVHLSDLDAAMGIFVLPLTLITLAVITVREFRDRTRRKPPLGPPPMA